MGLKSAAVFAGFMSSRKTVLVQEKMCVGAVQAQEMEQIAVKSAPALCLPQE